MDYILEWILYVSFLLAIEAVFAIMAFCVARWCMERRRRGFRALLTLALAVLGVGIAYGLLRLTGLLRLPVDNVHSTNFWGTSWRDSGFHMLLVCSGPFGGITAAFAAQRKKEI